MSDYPQTQLYIGDVWRDGSNERLSIVDPASDEIIGTVANAGRDDLDEALAAASAGFNIWREISGFERSKVLRNAAQLLRDGVEKIATIMTLEQGKPIAESRSETLEAANTIDWFAEEARGPTVELSLRGLSMFARSRRYLRRAVVGAIVLPLMLFHQIQLMVCAVIAQKYAAAAAPA